MAKIHDRERPSFEESNNVTVKRCFYAYEWAEQFIKGKRIADIGCGTGILSMFAADAPLKGYELV